MKYATTQGTSRFASNKIAAGLPPSAFRKLGRTQWTTSVLGFGSYRVDDTIVEHQSALEKALQRGCNLIDTSTNYTDGNSEICVGQMLSRVFRQEKMSRDEVVVISKAGYVQGQTLDAALKQEQEGKPFAEMVKYTEGCWHCIHPDFLSHQLSRTLERLNLERVDVYLLHNPEYFFSDAKKHGSPSSLPDLRKEFYRRIYRAFQRLEEEVEKGRVTCYGVSSNTLGADAKGFETVSLTRLWEIARQVAEDRTGDPNHHRFSVVQMPANLFEGGAILEKNNGDQSESTVLEFAEKRDLGVLVNRPLNALVGSQTIRLADFTWSESEGNVAEQLTAVSQLENSFIETLVPHIHLGEGSVPATEFFRWGRELSSPQLDSIPGEHWSQLESQMIRPQVRYLLAQLDQHFGSEGEWKNWRNQYVPELEKLLSLIGNECAKRSQKISQTLSQRLDKFLPERLRPEPLSRKALAVMVNTPGVSCVLNGMRRPNYVEDALGVMSFEPFPVKARLFESFRLDV